MDISVSKTCQQMITLLIQESFYTLFLMQQNTENYSVHTAPPTGHNCKLHNTHMKWL